MRNTARLLAGLVLVLSGLAATPPAQASDSAFTWLHYDPSRGFTPAPVLNVKCHVNNAWRGMSGGQTTAQTCGGSGWIERTWVPDGWELRVQNRYTGGITTYPNGCNCSIGGGYYDAWMLKIIGT